jgi:hypothetical protein
LRCFESIKHWTMGSVPVPLFSPLVWTLKNNVLSFILSSVSRWSTHDRSANYRRHKKMNRPQLRRAEQYRELHSSVSMNLNDHMVKAIIQKSISEMTEITWTIKKMK